MKDASKHNGRTVQISEFGGSSSVHDPQIAHPDIGVLNLNTDTSKTDVGPCARYLWSGTGKPAD